METPFEAWGKVCELDRFIEFSKIYDKFLNFMLSPQRMPGANLTPLT